MKTENIKSNKEYQEHITILCNKGGDMLVKIRARSLQKKVTKWRRFDDKWKPAEIEWCEPFNQIFKDACYRFGVICLYNKFISRSDIPRFFLMCDMYDIAIRCDMKRRGKFTRDEWELIQDHLK